MQDIAGCRVVVSDVLEQDQFVASLKAGFPEASVMDRRDNPSHGYRAVHVIVEIAGKPIEIQVRSALQHLWAEVSEKSSDVLDPTIKYGGGTDSWRGFLTNSSHSVAAFEEFEKKHFAAVALKKAADVSHEELKNALAKLAERNIPDNELREIRGTLEDSARDMAHREQLHQDMQEALVRLRKVNADMLTGAISQLDKLKGQKQ